MRLGLLARGDFTGLSVQAQALYKHLKPAVTLLVDLSRHSGHKPDESLFNDAILWNDGVYPSVRPQFDPILEDFLDQVDVVLACETPYNYWLFERAREKGVKTVLQFNYEFLDYPLDGLPEPDVFLAHSMWEMDAIKKMLGEKLQYLPFPVDREFFPFKKRTQAVEFLHTVGTGTGEDRNGTHLAVQAMDRVESKAVLYIRSQRNLDYTVGNNVRLKRGIAAQPSQLYDVGDCFIFPRRFGGMCLPLNEAVSCGMPVLVTDCDPQTAWVPDELRISVASSVAIQTRQQITSYACDVTELAEKIDWLFNEPNKVREFSLWADWYAQSISWEQLLPAYQEILNSL